MNSNYPVYTTYRECHDCYKCVRCCPSKAIKVRDGSASIITSACVSCGECVLVCPAKAKKIRCDIDEVQNLIVQRNVVVSIAPSWVSCFENTTFAQLKAGLQKLGFVDVFETAVGADMVSARSVEMLNEGGPGIYVSSACPAAVEYIRQYIPEFADRIMQLPSPAVTHARLLKKEKSLTRSVVFIGPCAAKKLEAEQSDDIDAVLTFDEITGWLADEGIDCSQLTVNEEVAAHGDSGLGVYYPIEGGMLKYIEKKVPDLIGLTISGLNTIEQVLSGEESLQTDRKVFIEVLACVSGCVNGPGWSKNRSAGKLSDILKVSVQKADNKEPMAAIENCEVNFRKREELAVDLDVSEEQIKMALAKIGKYSREDELNCAGCGYQTCRNFAKALVAGKAESAMCVSYMRKLAQKKANALLRYIPAGVVVVAANLQIIECNRRFATIFGEAATLVYDECEGMHGADLKRIVPFTDLFKAALASGKDVTRSGYHLDGRIIDVRIFNVEPHVMVGAIIEDVTEIVCRREKIAEKAREVINKNVATVQQIAKCLGEHVADTELLLRQVANGFEDNGKK